MTEGLSVESQYSTPEFAWVRYSPRNWPAPGGWWTNFAKSAVGRKGRSDAALPAEIDASLDDVLYLPPVSAGLDVERLRLAEAHEASGVPVCLELRAGVDPPIESSVNQVWDLLGALVEGTPAALEALPSDADVVWPLIAGVTDETGFVEAGLDRLVARRVRTVQPMTLELSTRARRRLAEISDEAMFDRLFHSGPPDERAFARLVRDRGLRLFLERPEVPATRRSTLRRRCAGRLRVAAELLRRLGRSELDGQRLLRAARWIDREDYDLEALVAEDNLEIVDWLNPLSRRIVVDTISGVSDGSDVSDGADGSDGSDSAVAELMAQYVAPARTDGR